jgi:hypothetical protein
MKKLLGLIFLFIIYFISPANAEKENPKLYCSHIKENGEFGDKNLYDLNSKSFKNLEISNSLIKFTFETNDYFVSSDLNKDTKLLNHNVYKDSERKILEFRQSWHCEDNQAKLEEFIQAPKKVEQTPKVKRTVDESNIDIAWKVDDKFIIPECFDYMWVSMDNYQVFFDEYIKKLEVAHYDNKEFHKFVIDIGTYLNKEVPLGHFIDPGWSGVKPLSLTKKLKGCLSNKPETDVSFNSSTTFEDGNTYSGTSNTSYEVLESYDLKVANKLAPHVNQKFESIKKVKIKNWGGGSRGHDTHILTYGLITLDGEKALLPLKHHNKFN